MSRVNCFLEKDSDLYKFSSNHLLKSGGFMADYFIEDKDKINTVLETSTDLEGELFFKTSLKIKGKFQGKIFSEGLLFIAPEAEVEADIYTRDVVIAGKVTGNVSAQNKLEIEESGALYGDIQTYKLKIADGVIFEGNCEMLSQDELKEKADAAFPSSHEKPEEKRKTPKAEIKKEK